MCLGLPGRVLEVVDEEHSLVEVEIGERVRTVSAAILTGEGESVREGDWLEIHSGHALAKLDEDEAEAMIDHIRELDEAHRKAMEGRWDPDGSGDPGDPGAPPGDSQG